MKIKLIGFFVVIIALSLNFSHAQDNMNSKEMKKMGTTKTTDVKSTGKFVNNVCIVSHEEIDSKYFADYNGKTYGFCCNTCLKKFKKDPAKYVAKFETETSKKDKKLN